MPIKKYDWETVHNLYVIGDRRHPTGYTVPQISKLMNIPKQRIYGRIKGADWDEEKKFEMAKIRLDLEEGHTDTDVTATLETDILLKLIKMYADVLSLSEEVIGEAKGSDDLEVKMRAIQILGSPAGMSRLLKDIQTLAKSKYDRKGSIEIDIPDNWKELSFGEIEQYVKKGSKEIIEMVGEDKKGKKSNDK